MLSSPPQARSNDPCPSPTTEPLGLGTPQTLFKNQPCGLGSISQLVLRKPRQVGTARSLELIHRTAKDANAGIGHRQHVVAFAVVLQNEVRIENIKQCCQRGIAQHWIGWRADQSDPPGVDVTQLDQFLTLS